MIGPTDMYVYIYIYIYKLSGVSGRLHQTEADLCYTQNGKQICYACWALRAEASRSILNVSDCHIQLLKSLRFFCTTSGRRDNSTGSVSRGQLKCDGTRAETRFRLSAKRTRRFKSAGRRQFSRLLAAEVCASAVVMLDNPCCEVL